MFNFILYNIVLLSLIISATMTGPTEGVQWWMNTIGCIIGGYLWNELLISVVKNRG